MDILKHVLIGVLLLPTTCSAANDASLDALFTSRLISLNEKTVTIPQHPSKGTILSFYSPDCAWCERQIKSLDKFQQQCGSAWVTSLIGIRGNKQSLLKVLRKTQSTLPAFIATPEFLSHLPELEATPITVFISSKKQLVAVKRGYLELQHQSEIRCEGNPYG